MGGGSSTSATTSSTSASTSASSSTSTTASTTTTSRSSTTADVIIVYTPDRIKVTLRKGDIIYEQVDAVVNPCCCDLNLKQGGIAGAILKIGGDTIQSECNSKARNGIKFGEVLLTSGGNLKCQHVIHGACSRWPDGADRCKQTLRTLMGNILQTAHSNSLTSVALPAIGTGGGKMPPSLVATIMLEELHKFSSSNPHTTLKDIRVVLHKDIDHIIQAFQEAWQSWQENVGLHHSPRRPSSGGDHAVVNAFTTKEGVGVVLWKSGLAEQQVDVIVNTPGRRLNLAYGAVSSSLLNVAGKVLQDECHQNAPNGIEFGETVTTSGGNLKCDVVVHGACCDWGEGADKCKEVLRKLMSSSLTEADRRNKTSVAFPSIGTGQRRFPPHLVATVMLDEVVTFSQNNPRTSVKDVRFVVYPKDHETMQAFEKVLLSSGVGLQKLDLSPSYLNLPRHWSPMGSLDTVKLFQLASGSSEYKEVETLMMGTAHGNVKRILEIERIQNPSLYRKYMVDKEQMKKQCSSSTTVERRLYHGTSEDALMKINAGGFDRSYCGKNATAFGQGVYFAVNSRYSCRYATPSPDGKRRMYLAQVLTGDYTVGSSSLRVTPDNPNKPNAQFDSLVNDVSNPEIFVIFKDCQAYPSYLITFE